MATDWIQDGLERFSSGDLEGATRLWFAARDANPDDRRVDAYLKYIRRVAPDVYQRVEATHVDDLGTALAASQAHQAAAPTLRNLTDEPDPRPASAESSARSDSPNTGFQLVAAAQAATGDLASDGGGAPGADAASEVSVEALQDQLRKLLTLDDLTQARRVADKLLELSPKHAFAMSSLEYCRRKLTQMYESKLGGMQAVPAVLVPAGELVWLDLDDRAGFVLSIVDGNSSFMDILAITALDRLDTLKILVRLLDAGVIGVP